MSRSDLLDFAYAEFTEWLDDLPLQRRLELAERRPERGNFRFSDGWVTNFMRRKKIVFRRKTSDSTHIPADAEQRVNNFRRDVRNTVDANHVRTMFNMNETFMQLDFTPMYTAETKGTVKVDIKSSRGNPKLGCTVGLTIGSNGEGLPAHVVFGRPGFIREIENLDNVPDNILVTSSQSGWENHETLQHWLDEVFFPFIGDDYEPNEFLLILDRFRPHQAEEFCTPLVEAGVLLADIPARCSPLTSP